jgi:hypothetical protein
MRVQYRERTKHCRQGTVSQLGMSGHRVAIEGGAHENRAENVDARTRLDARFSGRAGALGPAHYLVFAVSAVLHDTLAVDSIRTFYYTAHILGCSTGCEIWGGEVSDDSSCVLRCGRGMRITCRRRNDRRARSVRGSRASRSGRHSTKPAHTDRPANGYERR